jgi:hypothetical protein
MEREVRRIQVEIASNKDTRNLLSKTMALFTVCGTTSGAIYGCTKASVFAFGGYVGLAVFLVALALMGKTNIEAVRLREQLDEALGADAEQFAVRNPMAQVRQDTEGYITIRNADGSPLVGIREGSAAEAETRAMENERAGAGREESAPREEEELAAPRARSTRGLPAPSNRTHRGSRFRDIPDLPPLYPPINPAYAAFVADAGAAAGAGTGLFRNTVGYPRVGAIDDEREEEKEEEEEDRNEGFFAQQRRRNPFYMGIRGLPREE